MNFDKYRVPSRGKVRLKDYNPNDSSEYDGKKKEGKQALEEVVSDIETLQEQMYAEGKRRLIVLLQAMDTGGKDGVIRHVFDGVNPQGVKVASFKTPSALELSHDYLWRIHAKTPGKGEIVVFNRSHYEDVLVVRVHSLVGEDAWQKRYRHINEFERLLVDEGTTILKFYLHISLEEQAERFLARVEDPEKVWKFNPGDLEERDRWEDYMDAYQDVLNKTSTEWAPWYVIPSNKKWYRNLLIANIVRDTLKGFKMQPPAPPENLETYHQLLLGMTATHKNDTALTPPVMMATK